MGATLQLIGSNPTLTISAAKLRCQTFPSKCFSKKVMFHKSVIRPIFLKRNSTESRFFVSRFQGVTGICLYIMYM